MQGIFTVLFLSLTVTCDKVSSSSVPSIRVFDVKPQNVEVEPNGCSCVGYNCGCCQHLEVDRIKLNDTVCINVTYLDQDYGMELTLSVDGHVYINASFSARNPPPLCAALPWLKDVASLCVQFYNLNVTSSSFSGCLRVVAKLKYVTVEKINIGCFKIPPSSKLRAQTESLSSPSFTARTVVGALENGVSLDGSINDEGWEYKWSVLQKYLVRVGDRR
ncbi:uncharacterized protein LOC111127620 [Crassostrea virginica]